MKELQRIVSPDGKLILKVVEAENGTVAIGFENSSWHTHPEVLHYWLGVTIVNAVEEFIVQLTSDRIPIIVSIDGGKTIDPWVSDNLPQTLDSYGKEHCILRLWSETSC